LPPVRGDDAPIESEAARARLRRVIVKIFAVQIATLLGLWALGVAFGR
jgi:hypothetical protein